MLSCLCQTLGKFRRSPVGSLKKEQAVLRFENFNNGFILLLHSATCYVGLKLLTSSKQNALGSCRRNNHIKKTKRCKEKSSCRAQNWALAPSPKNAPATWANATLESIQIQGKSYKNVLVMLLTFSASIFLGSLTKKSPSRCSVIQGNNRNPDK